MERNARMVAEEVQKRVNYAPVLSEYITAYKQEIMENIFSSRTFVKLSGSRVMLHRENRKFPENSS